MRKKVKSILTTQKGTCYVCQRQTETELHHIFFGSGLRKISDKLGLVVYLCPNCHRGTLGVHGKYGAELNRQLKMIAQEKYEETHSRAEWMEKIGRSWL